jgi:hypothetical protein
MDPREPSSVVALRRLVNGYQVSQALHVAATLGIADLLAAGPRTSAEIAAAVGAHPRALYRLLRTLASLGVFHEDDTAEHRFALTPLGEGLRTDTPDSVAGWAAYIGQPYSWSAWAQLLHSVQTGENAFRQVHGMDVWEYRAQHPDDSAAFDRAMTANTRQRLAALLAAYDFSRFATIVDVGGGRGAFLAALLAAYPTAHGVLFDRPHVVAGAETELRAAGIADRCRITGGDFFQAVPTGGDAYVLMQIVHDWEDAEATAILRRCREAMRADARLLVIEWELLEPNAGAEGKLTDLVMLVTAGGQERTRSEYAALFAAAGFQLAAVTPTTSGWSIFEGALA